MSKGHNERTNMDKYRVEFTNYRRGGTDSVTVKAENRGKAITAACRRHSDCERDSILSARVVS